MKVAGKSLWIYHRMCSFESSNENLALSVILSTCGGFPIVGTSDVLLWLDRLQPDQTDVTPLNTEHLGSVSTLAQVCSGAIRVFLVPSFCRCIKKAPGN